MIATRRGCRRWPLGAVLLSLLALLALLAFLGKPSAPGAAELPPAPTAWVTDGAQVLSASVRETLNRRLAEHERASGQQVLLWIGRDAGGDEIEPWAARVFAAWGVGRRGLDDGAVIFVLAAERRLRVEVGYGLEPVLTDATASRVLHEHMVPRLAKGDWDGAATAGVDAVLAALGGPTEALDPVELARRLGVRWWHVVLGALALLGFIVLLITHPALAVHLLFTIASGRGGGGGFGRSGGWSGGGGRSGGGGASARW